MRKYHVAEIEEMRGLIAERLGSGEYRVNPADVEDHLRTYMQNGTGVDDLVAEWGASRDTSMGLDARHAAG